MIYILLFRNIMKDTKETVVKKKVKKPKIITQTPRESNICFFGFTPQPILPHSSNIS